LGHFPRTSRSLLTLPPVLALDLGGTRIRAAVIQPDGTRLARFERDTPTGEGPAAIVAACSEAVIAARAGAPADLADGVVAVGISSPGPVDPTAGIVLSPPNFGPGFRDVPLAARVSTAVGLPAFLDRDTNVAALGEHAFGAARGIDDFIYLTVSTGVGGAIVTNGRILHGPDGLAGELGHVPVSMDDTPCTCSGVGHVEAFASGAALARDARALVAAGRSPFLARRAAEVGPDSGLSARDVAEGALAGDPACVELMVRARRAIATACVGFVHTFNPHRIVIGGAIADSEGERLLGPIRSAIAAGVFEVFARHVTVVPAGLGGDVSLAGAQPLVMSRLGNAASSPTNTPSARPPEPVAALPRR
jgi:glucokinase